MRTTRLHIVLAKLEVYLRLLTIQDRRVGNEDEFGAVRAKQLTLLPFIKPLVLAAVAGV